jgi:phosphoglycolate phosphatase
MIEALRFCFEVAVEGGVKVVYLPMAQLQFPPHIRAIIFDKDGTLIDFNAMWATWLIDLAGRLESRIENEEWRKNSNQAQFSILNSQFSISELLFQALDFDYQTGRVIPGGRFAVEPMARLRELTVEALRVAGMPGAATAQIVDEVWYLPDPVALALPLADLPALFGALRARGIRIAVATSDDHAPTAATLASLGVGGLVDAVCGADDGVPNKPAPDMVLRLCEQLDVTPERVAVVGDEVADLQMGRAAGVGLVVGVLSGLSSAALLAPNADALVASVADLIDS